jgi:hypothetical protein
MMEATRSSEVSVLTRTSERNIPEDGILHGQRRENLKFYILVHARTAELSEVGGRKTNCDGPRHSRSASELGG